MRLDITSPRPEKNNLVFLKIDVKYFGGLIYYIYLYIIIKTKIDMTDSSWDFEIDSEGEWNDMSPQTDDCTEQEGIDLMEKIVSKGKIVLGEKSEGTMEVENDVVILDYRWCSEVGEDWDSDVWNDEHDEFPLSDLD